MFTRSKLFVPRQLQLIPTFIAPGRTQIWQLCSQQWTMLQEESNRITNSITLEIWGHISKIWRISLGLCGENRAIRSQTTHHWESSMWRNTVTKEQWAPAFETLVTRKGLLSFKPTWTKSPSPSAISVRKGKKPVNVGSLWQLRQSSNSILFTQRTSHFYEHTNQLKST